ncbi:MAG: RluA family pseudouridine synthase [Pseudobdellovibrionaceae bacterium]
MFKNENNLTFSIIDESEQVRIDQYLATKAEIGSRTKAIFLIDEQRISVNQKIIKPSYKLRVGDQILVRLPEPAAVGLEKYNFPLDIVFEDSDLIVVNKPAGLVVHPAHGHQNDTLVNALLFYTRDLSMRFGEERPGIVHRIDKETSGLLVVAKNDLSHEKLSDQFKSKKINRIYEAIVYGHPKPTIGHIESRLARHPQHRKKFASVPQSFIANDQIGKLAITDYRTLKSTETFSLIELKLTTGRTHQIRVHLSELGYPIVGDVLYGADKKTKRLAPADLKNEVSHLGRFLLHAKTLGFFHPRDEKWIEFHQPWPLTDKLWMQKWNLQLNA